MPPKIIIYSVLLFGVAWLPTSCRTNVVKIGSKKFTESVILGEIISERARVLGFETQHFQELGGTRLVFDGLVQGDIDAYPEYTGTLDQEILSGHEIKGWEDRERLLALRGIAISKPIGFNNTYAIGMLEERAQELGINKISDLNRHPDLKFGLTSEFMDRDDGWRPLQAHYSLRPSQVTGMDHDIAYRQLEQRLIDVLDVYSTDAKIKKLGIRVLKDDRAFFPRYDAVVLYRADWRLRGERATELATAWDQLGCVPGRQTSLLDERKIIELNNDVEFGGQTENFVARRFLEDALKLQPVAGGGEIAWWWEVAERTGEHLDLVRRSLLPAIFFGVTLGVLAHKRRRWGQLILGFTGIVQTIPGLALLVLLMPLVGVLGFSSIGVGSVTVVLALFLYSLLPIVAGTYSGLSAISRELIESADSLGMTNKMRLWRIELPLASTEILSGIRTAAVMNVGFATLGALIGAGGYGQPILTGIRLNDQWLVSQGAIPAALLAILVLGLFGLLGRWIVPAGLQISTSYSNSN